MFESFRLLDSDPFRGPGDPTAYDALPRSEQMFISHSRARAVGRAYSFTPDDILRLTPKYWNLYLDPAVVLDCAAATLYAIHFNLCAGMIAKYLRQRPDLKDLLDRLLRYEVSGVYMLTELGHGLDAAHLETTATRLPCGDFYLHTPVPRAAKYMPAATPNGATPCVAVVFARLMVDGRDCGLRTFVVQLNDGIQMCTGITAKLLPARTGAKPINHALTSFNHVRIPATAMLEESLEPPKNPRLHFLNLISRITIGTLAFTLFNIPTLKAACFIAVKYSLRRTVTGVDGSPVPIISFRTQQRPVLHAIAQCAVFEAYAQSTISQFLHRGLKAEVQHGLVTAFKAVLTQATQSSLYALQERCGTQGLYGYNQLLSFGLELRANSVAEGDVTVLSIRLASELLQGRYELPAPKNKHCRLALHEAGLIAEGRAILSSLNGGHRSNEFNEKILPRCQTLVEAIGCRFAYEAAVEAKVDAPLLDLYEAGAMLLDTSWYVENLSLSREDLFAMEVKALSAVLPNMESYLDADIEPYCTAPIMSDDAWASFSQSFQVFEGKTTNEDLSEFCVLETAKL